MLSLGFGRSVSPVKVLEIVKREAFEAPICSFFFIKSQRTPRKIQLIPRRGNARLFLWPGERAVKGPIQRGQGGEEGQPFFFSCLAPLVSCKRVFVLGEMGALFLGFPVSQHQFFSPMFYFIASSGREKPVG
jgi:hypothetical protein